jgi:hypothetical protein
MSHVILLGDSIFDNARYVPGGPAVIEQVRRSLPRGWRATLLAIDGAVTSDVPGQLARVPADATHLVVSVGGNDALEQGSTALGYAANSGEAMQRLTEVRQSFRREYRAMLDAVLALGKPAVVCTVYDAIPTLNDAECAGLALFNEVILYEAFRRSEVAVIDLRLVCNEASDYAKSSPIEPSVEGGWKIARAISRAVSADAPDGGIRVIV